ncbi:MAG: PilN domain-containing protein [Phycisphaerales bacterium]|nr:PilN domain-containing protein [Phycisphaerales bacterium]
MNAYIDLMPTKCRAALQRRARVRMWVGAYASTAAILISLYAAFTAGRQAQLRELADLNNQVELNWSRDHEVQTLMTDIETLENDIRRYDRLAWPLQISDVLQCVAGLTPAEVTLTSLAVVPKTERARRSKTDADDRAWLAIELEGVAARDGVVAELVRSLEGRALFKTVSLDYARPADVDGVDARRFRVTGLIDLKASYKFFDAPATSTAVVQEEVAP